ncbi:MAG: protease modulator HflC [Morganella sp. (in: enterobacteria)]|uniref:protease modulator HflC n=1 Tax=Morganella psychrotolerans TaxID=368603 RepID=UPI0039AED434
MRKYLAVIVILVLGVLYASVFAVQQTERGIVLRFGKVLRDSDNKPIVYEPGLHLKVPFIETVKMLPARIQTLDIQADRFLTNENKDLIVDSYLKWRISDFSLYYLATNSGNINQAENLLKRKFSDRLRSEFGRLSVKEIVTDSRGTLTTEVKNALNEGSSGNDPQATDADNAIADAAARVQEETKGAQLMVVNPNSMAALGIEVVDVRIKQINLPAEVSEAIFQRMRAEREAVARRHRSQGLEEAMKIRAIADKTRTEMLAESERQSLTLRGAGDAEAAKLFADAFSQDPDFYAFIRSLRAYEQSFKPGGNDIMVLSPDTDFFRYMKAPTSLRPVSGQ